MVINHGNLLVRSSFITIAASLMLGFAGAAQAQDQAQNTTPPAAESDTNNDIIVTGERAALREAISEKRIADNIEETLHANDVGKLPDQNVAEAVKRLPGLSVANDQGEGRYVVIRGMDPSLINVTLNGQTLPAPEPTGRNVKLDDLPSAMIQSITVTKSLLPWQDANAIGGSVDIHTKTAFDSKDAFFFDARGALGLYSLNHKTPWESDATIGGRFGADQQFGAVVSVNYSERPIESENYQGATTWLDGKPVAGSAIGPRDYNLTRTRLGVVGNFDWHPSDSAKIYIRSSYSRYQDHETRDQNLLTLDNNIAADNSDTAVATVLVRHREENDNTKSVTLGGEFAVGGGTLSLSGGWTRAEKVDPIRSEFTFKGPDVPVSYDPSTYPFSVLPTGASAGIFNDPTQFTFSKLKAETRFTYEQIWQARIDYSHPIPIGSDSTFQIGFKYLDRHKDDDHNLISYSPNKKDPLTLDTVGYAADPNFYNGLFHFGDRINWYQAMNYITNVDPKAATFAYAGNLVGSLTPDYDVREQILAGYVMATLKFGALTLIPGIRIEHTRDVTAAKSDNPDLDALAASITTMDGYVAALAANNAFDVFARNSYTNWFPGLNAKLELKRNLLLRGAVTTSIGRPNYSTLAPYLTIEDAAPYPVVTAGNPYLKPYKALNFDASLEYYPGRDSLFSAAFFYKHIRNPIFQVGSNGGVSAPDWMLPQLAAAGEGDTIMLTSYQNLDSEFITGIELNAQTQFTHLPGFLSGFGISANYTHVWGHAKGAGFRTDGTDNAIPLTYQSHDLANVSIFYEKYGFAARLAFNYRSAFSDVIGTSAATDSWWDGQGQLDLHMSYQVTPQYTIFTDAINLTDSPWRHYIGDKANLAERERYGETYRIGVQLHF